MSKLDKITYLGLLIASITQFVVAIEIDNKLEPKIPIFAKNYYVQGVLSLPYAELNEPFTAWFDKGTGKSRTDYYGDLYKIYQFGPNNNNNNSENYGEIYKFVWVPENFQPGDTKSKDNRHLLGISHGSSMKAEDGTTGTKRHCFVVQGAVGNTISPQTVLPDLSNFVYDSTGRCPHRSPLRHSQCELWRYSNDAGDKRNTYKMWITRDKQTGQVYPVKYYMLGYDSLLGSHYDRYDVTYHNFKPNGATEDDFFLDNTAQNCGAMPGPGDDATDGERRSHTIINNPIHEFVVDPHRYDHIDHEFDKFIKDHEKSYPGSEQTRKGWLNFLHNFRFINGKNRELQHYKLKVNRYADNDLKELNYLRGKLQSTGYNGGLDYAKHHNLTRSRDYTKKLPDQFDWSIRGAVTPVKDQAVCGSCWSFGTSGTLEGAYFVKTGKLPRLSQQQMVDCSWRFGNNGCDGGEDFRAYEYIQEAGGIATEDDYGHYLGVDGKCHDKEVKKTVKISGFYNVTTNDVDALKHAIVNYGPVTVAIDASRPTFTFYSHGVYFDDKCNNSPDGLDHQVLVVGYAKLDGKFAWLVKNSWSTYWGNNGYILMSAQENDCGVMDVPTVPIIKL